MESLGVVVIIALAGLAPAIGSAWWLFRSRYREHRQAEIMSRMLAAYPPGPPPAQLPEPGPPLIVVRPRRPRQVPFQPSGRHARLD